MITRRWALILAGLFAALGLGLAATSFLMDRSASSVGGVAMVGGPFTLTDQDGRAVTAESLKGEPSLVFFGYTHCPDVCPTTLSDLTQMLAALGPDKKARAVFITVDPERDTPAVLKDYLSSFDPRIMALTGSTEAIAAAEKAYRVYARKVPTQGSDYSMDHTAIIYLMDRDGRFVRSFNLQQAPEKAARDFSAFL